MSANTENFYLNCKLTLQAPSQSLLPIHLVILSLTIKEETLRECCITFQINPELYRQIDTEALFNLKSELRGSFSNGDFQPEPSIEIQATLQPDLIPQLTKYSNNSDALVAYLQNLCQEEPHNPLLLSENWLALYVKQKQESGETGYSTFWSYINPSMLAQENISKEEMGEVIVDFFQDWFDANLSGMSQEDFFESFEDITKSFEEFIDITLASTKETVSSTFEGLTNVTNNKLGQDSTIFDAILSFFLEEDWQYTKIKGETLLHLIFQGRNSKWDCYAKAREKEKQMIFYSICPMKVPASQRLAMAELLTIVNYGIIIGNFEMNFANGEISYKTSIDVEGDRLSFALIKKLVYTNVTVMDEYLSEIISAIKSEY
jgi:hypothetical protein